MKIGYLPLGRETFDIQEAERIRRVTISALENKDPRLLDYDKVITDPEEAGSIAKEAAENGARLLLVQTCTFVDGRFAFSIKNNWDGPLVLWSVDEPQNGDRLRLNSLTGANLLSNTFRSLGITIRYIHGSPSSPDTISEILNYANSLSVIESMRNSNLGIFGRVPPGFHCGEADELTLGRLFGIGVKHFTLPYLFDRAERIPTASLNEVFDHLKQVIDGVERSPSTEKTVRAYLSLREIIEEENLVGVAVRCWPEFFTDFGGAACGALSQLCEDGFMSACEADINGLVSMIILSKLSGQPSYLGDMVAIDNENNCATFWHCGGGGAYSLAKKGTHPKSILHPNRQQGLSLDFNLKPGKVTITRLNKDPTGYRLLILEGLSIEEGGRHFKGTTVNVRFEGEMKNLLNMIMTNGIEHHYAIGYGHHGRQLREIAEHVGLEILDASNKLIDGKLIMDS